MRWAKTLLSSLRMSASEFLKVVNLIFGLDNG